MGNVKIVAASAGSGKTYRLAYEYVKSVACDPKSYKNILAVTFTNKATEEMKSRILERIHELAVGARSQYLADLMHETGFSEAKIRSQAADAQRFILHDYSRFAILTIDRFFQRLIRSFIRELGVDINFNLELETDSLLSLAADALIDDSAADENLRGGLFAVARERIDDGKRWSVKEPLLGLGRELFGEEYIRSRADAVPVERAQSLIGQVITSAEAAKKELVQKSREALSMVDAAGLGADDFKGKGSGVVPYLRQMAAGEFRSPSRYVRQAAGIEDDRVGGLSALLTEIIATYESSARLINSARLLRDNHRNFLLLNDLQQRIEQICAEENIMPIAETGRMIARLVGGNDTPFIFEKAGNYFSRFMIDEFQDTSVMQWENFLPLLRNAISEEDGSPVMLIGDVKQAIYRWRGGDWRILSERVRAQMGAERVEKEELDTNHRSMRRVVEFNNRAIELLTDVADAESKTIVGEGVTSGALSFEQAEELTAQLKNAYAGHTQKPKSEREEGYVTFTLYDADADGNFVPPVVEKVEELQSRGYRAGDIAVLVRSNAQAVEVAQMLLAQKHLNPSSPYSYDVVTQDALTVGAAAVSRFIIACLTLASAPKDVAGAPKDDISRAIFNRRLGRDYGAKLMVDDVDFFAKIAEMSPDEAFEQIVMRFGLSERAAEVAYVQAIHQQITTFAARSVADVPLFLKWWNERGFRASITMQGSADAITISTIHKAKGLEYKAVIVPFLSWSLSPHAGDVLWAAADESALKEAGALPINYKKEMAESFFAPAYYREQALSAVDALNTFYVAATRAEQELHLMHSLSKYNRRNSIGTLLRNVLEIEELATSWGEPVGRKEAEKSGSQDKVLCRYPTARPSAKIKLRLPSSRYFEEGAVELSPRDFGVEMHRAFEHAVGEKDIARALEKMVADGVVSQAEYVHLQEVIARAFADPRVAEWFAEGWDEVRNEGDILTPRDPSVKRPDRVMIRGERAVVVDYKFGREKSPTHTRQLRGYMSLLGEMGYTAVEGYVWYVSLGEILLL